MKNTCTMAPHQRPSIAFVHRTLTSAWVAKMQLCLEKEVFLLRQHLTVIHIHQKTPTETFQCLLRKFLSGNLHRYVLVYCIKKIIFLFSNKLNYKLVLNGNTSSKKTLVKTGSKIVSNDTKTVIEINNGKVETTIKIRKYKFPNKNGSRTATIK